MMLCLSEFLLLTLLVLKARGVHGTSSKCGSTKVCKDYNCTHQLQAAERGQNCEISSLEECEFSPKMAMEPSLKVNLTMFYRGNGLPGKVAFNLTLQGIYSNTTKFRFRNTKFDECDLCRQVQLHNVVLPHEGQVHWSCTFFEEPYYTDSSIELVVADGRGGGSQYYFRVPEGVRINGRANETTWQLFLLLRLSDLETDHRLSVSLQLAPFGGLNYTVVLVRCTSGDAGDCPENGEEVDRKTIAGPVEAPAMARQEAVEFTVTEIGMYVVTAQILSPRCNNCTFLSVSPLFEPQSMDDRTHRAVGSDPVPATSGSPRPQHHAHHQPVGSRPNHFTSTVRNRPCAATVVLPFSGEIPCQIFDLRRFRLPRDLPSMVTWTHHGDVTPNHYIMWRLHLHGLTSSLARVKSRMLQAMKEHRERLAGVTDRDASCSSATSLLLWNGKMTRTSTSEDPVRPATNGQQEKQFPTEGREDPRPGGEFDPMISSAEDLVGGRNRGVRFSSLASASENDPDDKLPDSVFM
nr:uncharacterized protein LOC113803161 isoform X2 [Penaeus vannamei]